MTMRSTNRLTYLLTTDMSSRPIQRVTQDTQNNGIEARLLINNSDSDVDR